MPVLAPGCSHVEQVYETVEKLGKGTFGEVHKALHRPTGTVVALKMILLHNEKEGFPVTSLREIEILQNLDHVNVVPLLEMAIKRGDRAAKRRFSAYMVMPYMQHDLAGLLDNPSVKLTLPQIKYYMRQILEGTNYIHQSRYLHRDIKAANLLVDHRGIVKIADFGLARKYFGALPTLVGSGERHSPRQYTAMVVTRWYRAPELILGDAHYTTAIDVWGVGCIFGEMFRKTPILQGNSDVDQGHRIFRLLGSPSEGNMPGFLSLPGAQKEHYAGYSRQLESVFADLPKQALNLLSGLLALDPLVRLSALGALDHAFFHTGPPEASPDDLPIYKDSHEMNAKGRKNHPDPNTFNRQSHVGDVSSRNNTPGGVALPKNIGLPPKPNVPIQFPPLVQPVRSSNVYSRDSRNRHGGAPPYRRRGGGGGGHAPYRRGDNSDAKVPPYRRGRGHNEGLDYD